MTPSRAPESVVGTLRVSGKHFREGLVSYGTVYPIHWIRRVRRNHCHCRGSDRARDVGSIPYRLESGTQWVQRKSDARTLLVCYEAGPTGFGLVRHLQGLHVACEVIAPGLIPRKPQTG